MKPDDLNYRHLMYFWAVAKEGSITRAAERLSLSVQTISTQLTLLERQLGQALFAPAGPLADPDRGRSHRAGAMPSRFSRSAASSVRRWPRTCTDRPRFSVGVTDAIPKLISFRLLESLLQPPLELRLECIEGEFEHLLGELALNRLDLVVADRSAPQRVNLKLDSHLLGNVGIALFGRVAARPIRARISPTPRRCAPAAPGA